ncbi:MAG: cell wall hydrolase [Clostridiales bacterium]|nr:cell wall hydrolase [Clostridiales bacterium]
MTFINKFLQKKRLRESNNGIYMVIVAYALSVILLVIGSDTFYNITSKADGLNNSVEVNKIRNINNKKDDIKEDYTAMSILEAQEEYIEKYNQGYIKNKQLVDGEVSDDTYWLMGFAMNQEEYINMLDHMENSKVFAEDEKLDEKTISSFSIDTMSLESTEAVISPSKEEIEMLERIVEAEATGEDIKGKILVANVILNRIEAKEFPDTIEEVIFQKDGKVYQFSPISDKRYWKVKVTKETKEAVQRALDGEDYSQGALYFMARRRAKKSSSKWFDQNLDWLFKHGGHEFYK